MNCSARLSYQKVWASYRISCFWKLFLTERMYYVLCQCISNWGGDGFCYWEPGLSIIPMQDQGYRFFWLSVNKQNYHLAITCVNSMIRAGAIMESNSRRMQIKSLHRTQACQRQLFSSPMQDSIAGIIDRRERRSIHRGLRCSHSIDFFHIIWRATSLIHL